MLGSATVGVKHMLQEYFRFGLSSALTPEDLSRCTRCRCHGYSRSLCRHRAATRIFKMIC